MTIDNWVVEGAQKHPEKPALVFGDQTLTYENFSNKIDHMARALSGAHILRGDRVAWYGMNHSEVFVLLFACARIGAIFVPLNWRLAEAEISTIVANCAPKLVVCDRHFEEAAHRLQGTRIVCLGDPISVGAKIVSGKASDPVLIVYTSGSTGKPKGVVLNQTALISNAKMSVEAHAMSSGDTVLNVLPLFHVGGLNILPTPAFSIGATVELHEKFDPSQALAAFERVNLAIMVPTVLKAILALPNWANAKLENLRALSIGSTDVPLEIIEQVQARGIPVIQIYGATETCPLAIYQTVDIAKATTGSIGKSGSDCQIRLVGENGHDVQTGQPGEIWVKGPNILERYWQDSEQTGKATFDGWFRTGDVATKDQDGLFWFNDRLKHIIISGGENIYPAELERVLQTHPSVAEVSVVGRFDERWGEIPVAVVVLETGITKEDLLNLFDGEIARYKHAKDVVFVESLPRNAMGKVVAADVRAMIENLST